MSDAPGDRWALVRRIEVVALVSRYAAYAIAAALFLGGYLPGSMTDFLIITAVVLAHNLYAHIILWTGRLHLFRTAGNFLVYLVEASAVAGLSGAEESEAYAAYILLIIGYSGYARRVWQVVGVGALCCLAYAIVIGFEAYFVGIRMSAGEIGVKFVAIALSGWIAGTIAQTLHITEAGFLERDEMAAQSGGMLRAILRHAPSPVVLVGEDLRIVAANEAAQEFIGMEEDSLVGSDVREFIFDDGGLDERIASLWTMGDIRRDSLIIRPDGEERYAALYARVYREGGSRYALAMLHDVTERKNLEEAARLATVDLERLNRELRHVDELKSNFVEGVSGRLRSPLTPLLGYLHMLLEGELGELNEAQAKAVRTCRRAALRIKRVVEEFLDLTRTGAER